MVVVKRLIALCVVLSVSPVTAAGKLTDQASTQMKDILQGVLQTRAATSNSKPSLNIRTDAIRTDAFQWGIQEGAYYEQLRTRDVLESQSAKLSVIADFSKFIVNGNLLVPQILMSRGTYEQISDVKAKETAASFTLHSNARIVQRPPTWRSYLMREADKPVKPDSIMLPRSDEERDLFATRYEEGFVVGVEHTQRVVAADFNRLYTTLSGLYYFKMFEKLNIVSLPSVDSEQSNLIKVGDNKTIELNSVVYEVNLSADFNDMEHWQPFFRILDKQYATDVF